MYPFVNLSNVDQAELDKFVIGTWVENHKAEDIIKSELTKRISKVNDQIKAKSLQTTMLKERMELEAVDNVFWKEFWRMKI